MYTKIGQIVVLFFCSNHLCFLDCQNPHETKRKSDVKFEKSWWKLHFITKLVKISAFIDCESFKCHSTHQRNSYSKRSNVLQRLIANEKCCEWNLHRNLIKCIVGHRHRHWHRHLNVFQNRLIKCFYIYYCCGWQKANVAKIDLQSKTTSQRYVFRVHYDETLIGIDFNSFSWFLSSWHQFIVRFVRLALDFHQYSEYVDYWFYSSNARTKTFSLFRFC